MVRLENVKIDMAAGLLVRTGDLGSLVNQC
jgi:hypothetical protein